jgi:hypothetical protein
MSVLHLCIDSIPEFAISESDVTLRISDAAFKFMLRPGAVIFFSPSRRTSRQTHFSTSIMLSEDAAAELEAVKAVFSDCIEESEEGSEAAQLFYVNILPDTGGIQVI